LPADEAAQDDLAAAQKSKEEEQNRFFTRERSLSLGPPAILARGIAMVVGPRLVVKVRERLPCQYPIRFAPNGRQGFYAAARRTRRCFCRQRFC